jgi:hypothetical protein
VGLFPGFQDECWFSTGHFADVMMGFGHDAEASSSVLMIDKATNVDNYKYT